MVSPISELDGFLSSTFLASGAQLEMPSCWLPQTRVDLDCVHLTHMSPCLSRPSNVSTLRYDIVALLPLMDTLPRLVKGMQQTRT